MKYLISHKGCTIIFDDKCERRRCKDCPKVHKSDDIVQDYLKGMAKLLVAVNVNNDWVMFGEEIQRVVTKLKNAGKRTKHREDSRERT